MLFFNQKFILMRRQTGFTLIELSIVLVIIGLIVGGVLAGRDLIRAAAVRATIAQIEKFQAATNTFRGKYEGLPGDLNAQLASKFGFSTRGSYAGQGDGNGVLEGMTDNAPGTNDGTSISTGETASYWVDLSKVNLIEGGFVTASESVMPPSAISATGIASYIPEAKLGRQNYILTYSYQNTNYLALQGVGTINAPLGGWPALPTGATGSLTVNEAAAIDAKADDGKPLTGKTLAQLVHNCCSSNLPGSLRVMYAGFVSGPASSANWPNSIGCYDNNGVAGVQPNYSVTTNNGTGVNCALSFQFQ